MDMLLQDQEVPEGYSKYLYEKDDNTAEVVVLRIGENGFYGTDGRLHFCWRKKKQLKKLQSTQ